MILHNVEDSVVQQDIHRYIQTELATIPQKLGLPFLDEDWATEPQRRALVDKSGKLFVYAATCIRFIGDDRVLAPREQLQLLLGTKKEEMSEERLYDQLDSLYMEVLRKSSSNRNRRVVRERFQAVVGSIVMLRQPLPKRSLALFVQYKIEIIDIVLRHLSSVIISPSGIEAPRIYHPSFLDFITDASRCTMPDFLIVSGVQEQRHALRCLKLMATSLKRDVAGIADPSLLNSEVEGFDEKVANALPLEVQYACRYWASHLSGVGIGGKEVVEALREFTMQSMLWWFEALSLIGSISIAARNIQEALRWAVCAFLFSFLRLLTDSSTIPMIDKLEMRLGCNNNPVRCLSLCPRSRQSHKSERVTCLSFCTALHPT